MRALTRSYEYGPCVGVTRMERWERAAALGLNPPLEVRFSNLFYQPVIAFLLMCAPIGAGDYYDERRQRGPSANTKRSLR